MIAGLLVPDEGTITAPKNYRINYLPQDPVFPEDQRIIDYIFDSDLPVIKTLKIRKHLRRTSCSSQQRGLVKRAHKPSGGY